MSDPVSHSTRNTHDASRSLRASESRSSSASRPFLGLLNPMGRHYQGYSQAASLLEEDEETQQTQRGSIFPSGSTRHVSWNADSQLNVLRHNDDRSSDDEEVPQSLMFEAFAPSKGRVDSRNSRASQPSYPSPSILPTTHPVHISMPPKPSDLNGPPPPVEVPPTDPSKPMRGLDAYERALWNWVNVYNLDLYLQEVYSYYEGKGIYCIALSQGLNLLFVLRFMSSLP